MVLVLTLCLVVVAYYLHYRWTNRRIYAVAKKLHGPAPWPIVGNGHLFMGSSESEYILYKCECGSVRINLEKL
jgi:hypothetical protein